MIQSLQNRSCGPGFSQSLRDLVGDVAGIKIRKDENVRAALHKRTVRRLLLRHLWQKRSIKLHFAVNDLIGTKLASQSCRFLHFLDIASLSARASRERKHGHARLVSETAHRLDGGVSNLSEHLSIGIDVDRTISKEKQSLRPFQNENRRSTMIALLQFAYLKTGNEGLRLAVQSGHHAVRVAIANH